MAEDSDDEKPLQWFADRAKNQPYVDEEITEEQNYYLICKWSADRDAILRSGRELNAFEKVTYGVARTPTWTKETVSHALRNLGLSEEDLADILVEDACEKIITSPLKEFNKSLDDETIFSCFPTDAATSLCMEGDDFSDLVDTNNTLAIEEEVQEF